MAINVPQLQAYMGAGLNILITGEAGTGKTAMLNQAAANLGLNVKYFSAATMDPIIDLIGIPVPDMEKRHMNFFRPEDIDEAEIVFIDELNRAPVPVLNAVFELIQFRAVNGVPLPKLKAVVAAINPVAEGYDTDELDIALVDRFDVYLESKVEADYQYLKAKFGEAYARAGVTLFQEYQQAYNAEKKSKKNTLGYMSPRRLEKLMEVFQKFPKAETVKVVLPSDVIVNHRAVATQFSDALAASTGNARGAAAAQAAMGLRDPAAAVEVQLAKPGPDLRRKGNAPAFLEAYRWARANDPVKAGQMLSALAPALNYNVGPVTIKDTWNEAVQDFSPTQRTMLMKNWDFTKREKVSEALGWV